MVLKCIDSSTPSASPYIKLDPKTFPPCENQKILSNYTIAQGQGQLTDLHVLIGFPNPADQETYRAQARYCNVDPSNKRRNVIAIQINLANVFALDYTNLMEHEANLHTLIHEMMHGIWMHSAIFPDYLDPNTKSTYNYPTKINVKVGQESTTRPGLTF